MAALWRGLTSAYALLAVVLLAFVLAVLSGLWPHGRLGGPGSETAEAFRSGSLLARGGWLANVYASWTWLSTLVAWLQQALLALVALVAGWQLMHAWIPSWATPPRRLTRTYWLTLHCDPPAAYQRVEQAFALGGGRLIGVGEANRVATSSEDAGPPQAILAVAERRGIARWASGLFYVGLLLLVTSVVVSQRWSWQGPRLDLALGETRPLEQNANLALRLEKIVIYPATSRDSLATDSAFSLLRGSHVEGEIVLREGHPLEYQGLRIYQVGLGPAARVTAKNAVGEPMAIRSLVGDTALQQSIRVRFSDQQQEYQVALPDADMVLRMVHYPKLPQQGFEGPVFHAQLLRGTDGQLLREQFLTESGAISDGSIRVDITQEYYVSVRAEREPELPLWAATGVLIAAGILGLALWPSQRAWVMVQPCPQGSICQLITTRQDDQSHWLACARALLTEAMYE